MASKVNAHGLVVMDLSQASKVTAGVKDQKVRGRGSESQVSKIMVFSEKIKGHGSVLKVRDHGQRSCIFESQRSGVNAQMSCVVQRLILEAKGHGYGSKV